MLSQLLIDENYNALTKESGWECAKKVVGCVDKLNLPMIRRNNSLYATFIKGVTKIAQHVYENKNYKNLIENPKEYLRKVYELNILGAVKLQNKKEFKLESHFYTHASRLKFYEFRDFNTRSKEVLKHCFYCNKLAARLAEEEDEVHEAHTYYYLAKTAKRIGLLSNNYIKWFKEWLKNSETCLNKIVKLNDDFVIPPLKEAFQASSLLYGLTGEEKYFDKFMKLSKDWYEYENKKN